MSPALSLAAYAKEVIRLAALLLLHDDLDIAYEQTISDAWTSEELGLA